MYFSGVQGVDSDVEITSETAGLSEIRVARIKTKFSDTDEKKLVYQLPYWWSQAYLLGNAEIHVAYINDDDVIENIKTIGMDTLLDQNEVKVFYKYFQSIILINFIRYDGESQQTRESVFLVWSWNW